MLFARRGFPARAAGGTCARLPVKPSSRGGSRHLRISQAREGGNEREREEGWLEPAAYAADGERLDDLEYDERTAGCEREERSPICRAPVGNGGGTHQSADDHRQCQARKEVGPERTTGEVADLHAETVGGDEAHAAVPRQKAQ
jgi:hypothetical protein